MKSLFSWLRFSAICALPAVLCQCTAPVVSEAWDRYDPLHPPQESVSLSLDAEAAKLQSRLIKSPGSQRNVIRLADIRFLQGRETEAAELYGRVLTGDLSQFSPESRARYGTALLHAERNAEARRVLEEVLEDDPNNARALLSYAEYQATILENNELARSLLARAKRRGGIYIPPDFEQALAENLN